MLGIAHPLHRGILRRHTAVLPRADDKALQVDGHPVAQINDGVPGFPVQPQGDALGVVVALHAQEQSVGGLGPLRLRYEPGRGDGGSKVGIAPVHLGVELLGDKPQGHQRPLHPVILGHAGRHSAGQSHALAVDHRCGGAQGEYDGVRIVEDDHLAGLLHPQHRGPQRLGNRPHGHQRAAVPAVHRADDPRHIQLQRLAVKADRHPACLGGLLIAAQGLVVELNGYVVGLFGGPDGPGPCHQQDKGAEKSEISFHG